MPANQQSEASSSTADSECLPFCVSVRHGCAGLARALLSLGDVRQDVT